MGRGACVGVREKLVGAGSSIHHVCPKNQTQAVRIGGKPLYPLSHCAGPVFFELTRNVFTLVSQLISLRLSSPVYDCGGWDGGGGVCAQSVLFHLRREGFWAGKSVGKVEEFALHSVFFAHSSPSQVFPLGMEGPLFNAYLTMWLFPEVSHICMFLSLFHVSIYSVC